MKSVIFLILTILSGCAAREFHDVAPLASEPLPREDCLEPFADARLRWEIRSDEEGTFEMERLADLDHDGLPDLFLRHSGMCGSGGCSWQVYLDQGRCARWVGEVSFSEIRVLDEDVNGLSVFGGDLFAGTCDWLEQRFEYDGLRYQRSLVRHCICAFASADDPQPDPDCEPFHVPGALD